MIGGETPERVRNGPMHGPLVSVESAAIMSLANKTTTQAPGGPSGTSDFGAMLAEFEREQKTAPSRVKQTIKIGQEVRGRILSIGRDSAFVDLGGKSDGSISLEELRGPDGQLTAQVGDEVVARVVEVDGRSGGVVLRKTLGRGPDARSELRQAFELGIPFEGQVMAVIKGGVEVQLAGVRGFCPMSQLDVRHIEDTSAFVGQTLQFRITKLEEVGRTFNVVLSRRELLEEAAAIQAVELRKKLAPGVVVRGRVTGFKDYGAFIDLGGLEGMLHISELSFQRARHPKDVLSIGQELEVLVLKIEPTADKKRHERISLSLKSLEKDPWSDIETQYPIGKHFPATVLRVETFGAIVELAKGIEGLIHITDLGKNKRLRHAKEALSAGNAVTVAVQQIDVEKRRLALSLVAEQDAEEFVAAGPSTGRAGFGTLGDLLSKTSQKKK